MQDRGSADIEPDYFSSAVRRLNSTFTRMPTISAVAMALMVIGAEVQLEAADAADQNGRHDEQVAMVAQIHGLNHLQAADRDEAVQRDADAADDAGGNRVDEGHEGIEEGQDDAVDRR